MMAKGIAPVQLTGGAGFGFEDKVSAKFLLDLLSGMRSLGIEAGAIIRVSWQTRDQGWLLDDLLLTTGNKSTEQFATISVKSHRQLTTAGFAASFVEASWEQWLGVGTKDFAPGRDLICLCTGELAGSV